MPSLFSTIHNSGAVLGEAFKDLYSITNLGAAPIPLLPPANLPNQALGSSGALAFHSSDPNTLFIGGPASLPNSAIYAVPVHRDQNNEIIGFGTATKVATAPGQDVGGIDAGLTISPDGNVWFYTIYPENRIGQIKHGSGSPSKFIDLDDIGIGNGQTSTGSVTFVPAGFTDAGRLKITSYTDNKIYDAAIVPDGLGTFNIIPDLSSVVSLDKFGDVGVDSITYIKGGNAGFNRDVVLVAEYNTSTISAYDLDPVTGDPIPTSRQVFLRNVGRPAQAPNNSVLSAVADPLTGDLLISTWDGQSQILKVDGFQTVSPSFLNLGNAGDYAAFGLGSGGKFSIKDFRTTILGDIGLGANGIEDFSQGDIIGSYVFDSPGKNTKKQKVKIRKGESYQSLAGAVNTALNVSALAATFKPTQAVDRKITRSTTIYGTAPRRTNGLNIINLDSIKLTDRNEFLTLNGTKDDYFLINVRDSIKLDGISTGIRLTGGITPSQVMFNLLAPSGTALDVSDGARLVGTYLAPWASVEFDSGFLNGGVIASSISLDGITNIFENTYALGPKRLQIPFL